GGDPVATSADIREAARLALPHRRRRGPFDDPGLDQAQLDDAFDPPDETDPPPEGGGGGQPADSPDRDAARPRQQDGSAPGDRPSPAGPRTAAAPGAAFAIRHLQTAGLRSGTGRPPPP